MRDAIRGNQRQSAHLLEEGLLMRDTITCNQRQSAHLLEEGLLMRDTITCNQRQSAHLRPPLRRASPTTALSSRGCSR